MTHPPLRHTASNQNAAEPYIASGSNDDSAGDSSIATSIELSTSRHFDSTAGFDSTAATVYIIEPESLFRQMLKTAIDQLGNFHVVGSAPDFSAAEDLLIQQPEILVTEMFIAGKALSALIDQIRPIIGKTKVLILTRDSDQTIGRQLQQLPAYGIVSKQEDPEKLFQTLELLRLNRTEGIENQVSAKPANAQRDKDPIKYEDPINCLSPREREIFQLLADGLQNTVIAKKLFISPRTVETHRARVVRKLGLSSNGDLIRFAIKHGLSSL